MDRAIRKFLVINWIPLSVGFVLTAMAVKHMFYVRGGGFIGSEYFIIPLLVAANMHLRKVRRSRARRARNV